MCCPYFEPDAPLARPVFQDGRLPLIEEYRGECLSASESHGLTGGSAGYRSCNQGYARETCPNYPTEQPNGAFRYSLLRCNDEEIEILWIREEDHSPLHSMSLHYSIARDCVAETDVERPVAAQASAFCRSYLHKVRPLEPTIAQPAAGEMHCLLK
jgi:hypothetical protein